MTFPGALIFPGAPTVLPLEDRGQATPQAGDCGPRTENKQVLAAGMGLAPSILPAGRPQRARGQLPAGPTGPPQPCPRLRSASQVGWPRAGAEPCSPGTAFSSHSGRTMAKMKATKNQPGSSDFWI